MTKLDKNDSDRIDPDWMTVTSLVVSCISTAASLASYINQDRQGLRLAEPDLGIRDATTNMREAIDDIQRALAAIENIFREDQNRRLENDFELAPRFGFIKAWLTRDQFREYQRAETSLMNATNTFRIRANSLEASFANNSYPREEAFFAEMRGLRDAINEAFFDSATAREQLVLINDSLERLDRALTGISRRN